MNLSEIISQYSVTVESLTQLSQWYNHCLNTMQDVLIYATEERELSLNIIEKFCLGYAPETSLTLDFLKENTLDRDPFLSTGNFHTSSGIVFDKLQDRLVFPIMDLLGGVTGFSGRIIPPADETIRKYFNSPTSLVYKKSLSLYGLYQSLPQIQNYDFVVLVEGNIDVCMSHQAEVDNVVAPCGTALRAEHLLLLRHFTSNIVCCFDNDAAGKVATTKARTLCRDYDCNFWQVSLTEAKDPDEFIRKFGGEEFKQLINNALKG
jgi:DNA primase